MNKEKRLDESIQRFFLWKIKSAGSDYDVLC